MIWQYLRRTAALRKLYIAHLERQTDSINHVGNKDRGGRWCLLTKGATRTVLLTKNYAIKFPGSWFNNDRWASFLLGLVCNMRERLWHNVEDHDLLCPVVFSFPAGFLIVMPRARPLSRKEWEAFDYEAFSKLQPFYENVEDKLDSFGWVNGKIVAIDYG